MTVPTTHGAVVLDHPDPAREGDAIEWAFDPWRDRPRRSAVAVLFGVGGLALLVSLREPPLLTLALAAALLGSLAPALLPVWCRVDGAGLTRRGLLGTLEKRWEEVRRVERRRGGLLVSPFSSPSWLDATRGAFLPLPESDGRALADRLCALAPIRARLRRPDA